MELRIKQRREHTIKYGIEYVIEKEHGINTKLKLEQNIEYAENTIEQGNKSEYTIKYGI